MNNLVTMHELSEVERPVFKIPLKDGSIYTLQDETLQMYKENYPRLDVDDALRRLVIWNVSNEKKRKTKGGILRHINGWLSRQPEKVQSANITQKEYAATTTILDRVKDLSWAEGL